MKRTFLIACLSTAFVIGLLSTAATAAPGQLGGLDKSVQGSSDLLVPVRWRGGSFHGFRHRSHHPRFAFFYGAPLYASYPDCWWSHRYHRRVCAYSYY